MAMPTFPRKTLSIALVATLAASAPAASAATDALTAVVAFGGHVGDVGPLSRAITPSSASDLPIVLPADIAGLAPEASRHFLSMVDASSFPLTATEEVTLARLFESGSPVLLRMDSHTPDDLARVSAMFGIAPRSGDMIVRNDGGDIEVFGASPNGAADVSSLLHALEVSTEPEPESEPEPADANPFASLQSLSTAEADDPGPAATLPARRFHHNLVDDRGEITGVTVIDIVRSRSVSSDFKLITVTSKASITPVDNGVSDGALTGKNAWTADLPLEYRLRHSVTAGDAEVTYVDHFPATDGRTDFTQTDTEVRKLSIGGETGAEISSSGKADETLAAKLPFKLTGGFEHSWQSSLTTRFQDYSILAIPSASGSVTWKALIAPKLKHVLVKRWGADLPVLTEERMTPMMRSGTFEAISSWQVPGTYEGLANVGISAGYDLDRKKWWWNRTRVEHSQEVVPREVELDYVIRLDDPYLSADITVLIRSVTGSGACLRDNEGVVDLAPCISTERHQMWGLDAASRYVNRGSGRCLTAQPVTRSVVTEPCENITFEKQWQWRGDRLHALSDHTRYRLYVAGGQVRVSSPGQQPDFPANFSHPALEPWTNYPAAPRQGIDLVVGSAGTRPVPVGPEYAGTPAVSDDQRWRIEVLRQGL
jgi:hypothetical protein